MTFSTGTFSAETDPVPADFGTRFSAWMIDACLLFAGQAIVLLVLARQLQSAGMTSQEPCSPESPIMCEGPNTALWTILFILMLLTTFGYHAWFDGRLGATPGKRWMGLQVVDHGSEGHAYDGRTAPIGIGRGLLRSVVRQGFWLWAILFLAASPIALDLPAVIFFGLLGLSLLTFVVGAFGASGRALHDLAVGAAVVRSTATPAHMPAAEVIAADSDSSSTSETSS